MCLKTSRSTLLSPFCACLFFSNTKTLSSKTEANLSLPSVSTRLISGRNALKDNFVTLGSYFDCYNSRVLNLDLFSILF